MGATPRTGPTLNIFCEEYNYPLKTGNAKPQRIWLKYEAETPQNTVKTGRTLNIFCEELYNSQRTKNMKFQNIRFEIVFEILIISQMEGYRCKRVFPKTEPFINIFWEELNYLVRFWSLKLQLICLKIGAKTLKIPIIRRYHHVGAIPKRETFDFIFNAKHPRYKINACA